MDYRRASLLVLFITLVSCSLRTTAAPMPWDGAKQGQFIVALAQDGQGQVWVGTEDQGVWRYNPANAEQPWTQFTTKDGLGDDNAYAIAVDKLGRVWVGHLNHGVSVYNGQRWANYGVLDGPLGERVFALATCPTDGDVWIATNAGLARYSLQQDTWSYFTRADGLVSDQMQALAFDRRGNLYAGTQCDGLAIAKAADGYKTWQTVPGPTRPTSRPYGKGLPSALINAVLVTHDGTVYVATDAGLAKSDDNGATWSYGRGKDWADKVKGRYGGPPNGWDAATYKTDPNTQLAEDYCTCLAEDIAGKLWVGHRQQGFEVFDPQTGQRLHNGAQEKGLAGPNDYVTTMLPVTGQAPIIGRYGNGLMQSTKLFLPPNAIAAQMQVKTEGAAPTAAQLRLPALAQAPTQDAVEKMLQRVTALPATPSVVGYLSEDWATQGDWVGRYGRQHAVLCAADYLYSETYTCDDKHAYEVRAQIGPHHEKGDTIRLWMHWPTTQNPNSLYYPSNGARRQSELDDHGEAYPLTHEGPDEWFTVKVPEGVHRVSFYFFNKDGHQGDNSYRDYLLEVKPYVERVGDNTEQRNGLCPRSATGPLEDLAKAETLPTLARARVCNFWGGVYKQFIFSGPNKYLVKISRNSSKNTICSAVLVDTVTGPYVKQDVWTTDQVRLDLYRPDAPVVMVQQPQPDKKAGIYFTRWDVGYGGPTYVTHADYFPKPLQTEIGLWDALNTAYGSADNWLLQSTYRRFDYQAAFAESDAIERHQSFSSTPLPQLLSLSYVMSSWRWQLPMWGDRSYLAAWDRQRYHAAMKDSWIRHSSYQNDPRFIKHPYLE